MRVLNEKMEEHIPKIVPAFRPRVDAEVGTVVCHLDSSALLINLSANVQIRGHPRTTAPLRAPGTPLWTRSHLDSAVLRMIPMDRMSGEENATPGELLKNQIDRILCSDEFHNSEVLAHLLQYLAEKSASGAADNLKEYTVAIEALGKPSSYDPQTNSVVRIQAGRLRQKLTEYYRTEGRDDPILIELPKGRFRLVSSPREVTPIAEEQPAPPASDTQDSLPKLSPVPPRRFTATFLIGTLLATAILSCGLTLAWSSFNHSRDRVYSAIWTPEIESLWGPFVASSHPLLVSIEDPLFVELRSKPGIYYRDRSLNRWEDLQNTPAVKEIGKALKNPDIKPSRYYTAFGETSASFLLGRLLGSHAKEFYLARASQLTWQQLADNNVIFIGVQNLFFEQIQGLPIEPQLIAELDGVRNPHPAHGEPSLFADQYSTAPTEQGIVYALVTHLPGPSGSNDIESFTSNRSAGYVGALQFFTNPNHAIALTQKLKSIAGGKMPRYYQVLLAVKFKDDVPTEINYVLSRELH